MAASGTKSSARPVELLTHEIPSPGNDWGFFCQTVALRVLMLRRVLNKAWITDGCHCVRRWSLARFQLNHHQLIAVTLLSWLL